MKAIRFGFVPCLLIALLVHPAASEAADEERMYEGIKYACAGVGLESRGDPRWGGYPLKIMFAAAGGNYLADLDVTINDASGAEVFHVEGCLAPWLLVDLAPGSYEVTAVARETISKSRSVTVGAKGQTKIVIRYPEITD